MKHKVTLEFEVDPMDGTFNDEPGSPVEDTDAFVLNFLSSSMWDGDLGTNTVRITVGNTSSTISDTTSEQANRQPV